MEIGRRYSFFLSGTYNGLDIGYFFVVRTGSVIFSSTSLKIYVIFVGNDDEFGFVG